MPLVILKSLEHLNYNVVVCVCMCKFILFPVSQAFNMIDQNRDGFIDNEDLKDMLASLGQPWSILPSLFLHLNPHHVVSISPPL